MCVYVCVFMWCGWGWQLNFFFVDNEKKETGSVCEVAGGPNRHAATHCKTLQHSATRRIMSQIRLNQVTYEWNQLSASLSKTSKRTSKQTVLQVCRSACRKLFKIFKQSSDIGTHIYMYICMCIYVWRERDRHIRILCTGDLPI